MKAILNERVLSAPIYVVIILSLYLVACGAGNSGRDTNGTGAGPRPTGAARPADSASSSTTGPGIDQDRLVFDNIPLQVYNHPSQAFSIYYPANWRNFERDDGVVFIDPTGRAAYSVLFSQVNQANQTEQLETPLSADMLDRFAAQFVEANFGTESNFEILDRTPERIQFKSTDPNLGPAVNEITVSSLGTWIYVTQITVVEDKWSETVPQLRAFVKTLLKTEPALNPTPTPAEGPPNWVLYTHPTERFAFLYPDTWTIDETGRTVTATLTTEKFTFMIETIPLTTTETGDQLAMSEPSRLFVLQQADELAIQYSNFQTRPVEAYQTGGALGHTIDYVYTEETEENKVNEESETAWAGSIIASKIGDRLFHIKLLAPAERYKAALVWFNLMMQSFQVLPEEDEIN